MRAARSARARGAVTVTAAVVALALSLLGCSAKTDLASRRRALFIARPGDALSLDPAAITDAESMQVAIQIYETLVRYRGGSTVVEPALATRWTVSDDGRVWTFHLRRGVYFHDGTSFDADAVVTSFERQRDHAHRFHFRRYPYWENTFSNITRVEKVDQQTVRIRIDQPYAPFLAALAMFPVAIVSPRALAKHGKGLASHPVGTGAYRFERWDRGQRIVTICRSGGRSDRAALELEAMGFREVASMTGGMLAVQAAGPGGSCG